MLCAVPSAAEPARSAVDAMSSHRALLRTLPQRALMALVRAYRLVLSPWLGNACRFEPTCSAYSLQALERHGAAAGTYMTLRRVARCHPFCRGGYDPVPAHPGRLFRSSFGSPSHPAATLAPPSSTDHTIP